MIGAMLRHLASRLFTGTSGTFRRFELINATNQSIGFLSVLEPKHGVFRMKGARALILSIGISSFISAHFLGPFSTHKGRRTRSIETRAGYWE